MPRSRIHIEQSSTGTRRVIPKQIGANIYVTKQSCQFFDRHEGAGKEMQSTQTAMYLKLFLALIVVAALLGILLSAVRTSGVAQSNNEREFEDKIPKHLPIKIKIQPEKERAAKNLNNGRWHHDLAFEVKNTGDKPIYYLSFFLDMPEIKPHGIIVASHLYYGQRSIFGEWRGWAQPGDIPLRPNETIVLALDKLQADGWDKRSKIEKLPQPNKLTIVFQELNFGDGTGFVGGSGVPWPTPKRPLAKNQNTVPAGFEPEETSSC